MQSPARIKELADSAKLAIEEHDASRDRLRGHLVAIYENYVAMLKLVDRDEVSRPLPGLEEQMQDHAKATQPHRQKTRKKKIDRREMFERIIREAGKPLNSREVWKIAAASGAPSDATNPSRVAEVTLRNLVADGRLYLARPGYFAIPRNLPHNSNEAQAQT